jgi:hypothetical protein
MHSKPRYAKAHAKPVADEYLALGWTLRHEFRVAPDDEPYEYFFEWCKDGDPIPVDWSKFDSPSPREDEPKA